MANEDPDRLAWIRTLPCCAPGAPSGCYSRTEAHHAGKSGMGQRPHDDTAIPICMGHHVPCLHGIAGPFKGWTRADLRAWEDEKIAHYRALWEKRQQADLALVEF